MRNTRGLAASATFARFFFGLASAGARQPPKRCSSSGWICASVVSPTTNNSRIVGPHPAFVEGRELGARETLDRLFGAGARCRSRIRMPFAVDAAWATRD